MRGRSRRGRGGRVAVACVVLLGLAGCAWGAGETDNRPSAAPEVLRALRTAHTATDVAGSAEVEAAMSVGGRVSTRSRGTVRWTDGLTGTLTITYTGGSLARTMRELGSTSTEARFVSDVYYARMSDKFAARSRGRHWIKYAYDASVNLAPTQSVALLLAAKDVRRVGEETARGATVTHYAGTVRTAELPSSGTESEPESEQTARLRKQLRQAGVTRERIDVWIDGHHRLVKRVERSDTAGGVLRTTASYSRFGIPVAERKAPPAGDTVAFEDLVGGQNEAPRKGS